MARHAEKVGVRRPGSPAISMLETCATIRHRIYAQGHLAICCRNWRFFSLSSSGGEPGTHCCGALVMEETFASVTCRVISGRSTFRQAMTDSPMEPVCP